MTALLSAFEGFVHELRTTGLPLSLSENLDALAALRVTDLAQREVVKAALAATLVKDEAHYPAFETAFEVYFSLRGPAASVEDLLTEDLEEALDGDGLASDVDSLQEPMDAERLHELLMEVLSGADQELVRKVASAAVDLYAGMQPGRPLGVGYYLYKTLRSLDLGSALAALAARGRVDGPTEDALGARLRSEERKAAAETLRAEIEAEVRRRLVAEKGPEAMAKALRRPLPSEVDFVNATREEMTELRRAIYPLTTRLAARLRRRRGHGRHGHLDFRATIRHSLASGGVPIEPRFRRPRPAKPELVALADVSGSVAAFARFTLCLLHALSSQFSQVRSFVFVDGIDEVTSMFDTSEDLEEALNRINSEADVVHAEGHSDYGNVFRTFNERWGRQVGPRSTVLVLGDARNNYHAASPWALEEVARRARRVYWLNPEPQAYWDTGDSIMSEYSKGCDGVYECRNLRQLQAVVDLLA